MTKKSDKKSIFQQSKHLFNKDFKNLLKKCIFFGIMFISKGDNMIKAPISKTGDIRYFEFIKIFILVSFFYALFSMFSELRQYNLITINSYVVNIILLLMLIIPIIALVIEASEIIKSIRSFIITYIEVNTRFFIDVNFFVNDVIKTLVLNSTKSYQMLCVVRC